MNQATQDAAAAQSALGAGHQLRDQRLDRRPCRHPGGGRGGARRLPLRPVAGGARTLGHSARRLRGTALGRGAAGRTAARPVRPAASAAGRPRRQGPCPELRDRRDGARLLALGLVAGALPDRRARTGTPRSTRWRCAAAAAASRDSTGVASAFRRPITTGSAPPSPPPAARSSASRSSGRPARCGSPRPTASSNAARRWCRKSCSGRRRAVSRWAWATRCSRRCRSTRTDRATGNGISANT